MGIGSSPVAILFSRVPLSGAQLLQGIFQGLTRFTHITPGFGQTLFLLLLGAFCLGEVQTS
eukprot:12907594-Prorocentrum_lima.AAC.1